MSFIDPPDDRPRRSTARRDPSTSAADRQAMRRRQTVAIVGTVVGLILLVLLVKGCRDAQRKGSFKDYAGEVSALVQESNRQGRGLFSLLRNPGDQSPVELQNTVNGFRVQAEQLAERAEDEGAPDEFARPHRYLVDVLEFRRDGLGAVARELPTALGDSGKREATARIATSMQVFMVSDVIYAQRVRTGLQQPLRDREVRDEVDIVESRFLPDLEWLDPGTVGRRLAGVGGDKAASPGLHGTTLGNVTAAGQALTPGAPVDLPATENLSFSIQVSNGGESAEKDVVVRVSVSGGPKPIEQEETVPEIAAGGTQTVSIPLAEPPPKGKQARVKVVVEPVPGEDKTDNNEATYQVTFGE